jgi:Na+-translocating ferredoxin:NAD+ oxidoreductase RnfD subunit
MDYSVIFTGVQSEVVSGITATAPLAATIFGTVLAISIAIKVFGKLAKKG